MSEAWTGPSALLVSSVEPVPALLHVRRLGLTRVGDQERLLLRHFVHRLLLGGESIIRVLGAAVHQSLIEGLARVAAQHVYLVGPTPRSRGRPTNRAPSGTGTVPPTEPTSPPARQNEFNLGSRSRNARVLCAKFGRPAAFQVATSPAGSLLLLGPSGAVQTRPGIAGATMSMVGDGRLIPVVGPGTSDLELP